MLTTQFFIKFNRLLGVLGILTLFGVAAAHAQSPPMPPALTLASPGLTANLVAEFVDPDGVRRNVSTAGEPAVIRGIAPLLVSFDASDSRANDAFLAQSAINDQEAYAFLMMGYRLNYGENIGGTWSYPQGTSYSRDEDTGPPIFSRVYRTVGTHTARLKVRDQLGNEAQVEMTVIVDPPPNTVHIPVSAGQWPNFVSRTRYTLQAGGDYRGFGTLDTGGRHNISFEKAGSGSDPRIASFSPDGRSKWVANLQMFEYRAAHIRLVNIDTVTLSEGQRGFDYVGVIGGRMGRFASGGQPHLWHEGEQVHRSNVRYARGLFLQDTEANNLSSNGFIMFGTLRAFHAQNTRFVGKENGSSTWLMLRLYGSRFSLRNNLWFLEIDGGSANGTTLSMLATAGVSETIWRADDLVGPLESNSNGARFGYVSEKQIAQNNQFYAQGSYLTNGVASIGGNPSGSTRIRPRLVGWEDNVWYPSGAISQNSSISGGQISGNYAFWRNNRKGMGQGDFVNSTTAPPNASVGDSSTYNGPYLSESTNTRPLPSAF